MATVSALFGDEHLPVVTVHRIRDFHGHDRTLGWNRQAAGAGTTIVRAVPMMASFAVRSLNSGFAAHSAPARDQRRHWYSAPMHKRVARYLVFEQQSASAFCPTVPIN